MAALSSSAKLLQRQKNGSIRINLRLTPKAKRNNIAGTAVDGDGSLYMKVSVTAVPEGGKANGALIKLLAKEWKLPKSSLSIIQGTKDRRKMIEIGGDMDMVQAKLAAWIDDRLGEFDG